MSQDKAYSPEDVKVFQLPRGKGKSTELIKLSAERGGYIVVLDRNHAANLASLANSMGLNIPKPLTLGELRSKNLTRQTTHEIYIDNLDLQLNSILIDVFRGQNLHAVSFGVRGDYINTHNLIEIPLILRGV